MLATSLDVVVKIAGQELPKPDIHDLSVESDLDQPDMASFSLSNQRTPYSEQVKCHDDVEIQMGLAGGSKAETVFTGEVIAVEPVFEASAPLRVVVRCFNMLHKLSRGKRSETHKDTTDEKIVKKLCQRYSLKAKVEGEKAKIHHDHVYQHNLTDLEFLRLRASRIGYQLQVQKDELIFCKRTDNVSPIKLALHAPGDATLERFLPRLSAAHQVSEVRVRSWDPESKNHIVGSAKPQSSKLGDKNGTESDVVTYHVGAGISSKEQADAMAKAILHERLMSFITGDGTCKGNPGLRPGLIVEVDVNDKRFSGKYFLTAVRHRYLHSGPAGGYRTEFKFRRDAESSAQAGQSATNGANGANAANDASAANGAGGPGVANGTSSASATSGASSASAMTATGDAAKDAKKDATADDGKKDGLTVEPTKDGVKADLSGEGKVGDATVTSDTSVEVKKDGSVSASEDLKVKDGPVTAEAKVDVDKNGPKVSGTVDYDKNDKAKQTETKAKQTGPAASDDQRRSESAKRDGDGSGRR